MTNIDCETATAQELAAAVVNYIEEHGWNAGYMGFGDGPVCLLGGVAAVCTGDPEDGFKVWDHPSPAVRALQRALLDDGQIPAKNGHLGSDSIYRYNDHDARGSVNVALYPFRRIAEQKSEQREENDA